MKKSLHQALKGLLVLIILSYTVITQAQVTHTESFDNTTFLPTGWTGVTAINYWTRRTTGTFPTATPHSGAGLARFASRTAVAGTAQTIATPPIDLSNRGSNTPTFSLWILRDTAKATIGDSLSILINTSASVNGAIELGGIARSTAIALPDTQAAIGWVKYSFNIPAGFNTDSNYILLTGTSHAGNNIFIDDIQWVAYPNVCTGTPNAGSIVPTAPLICNSNGTTTLTATGETNGFSGLSFVWQSASSLNGPWTVIDTNVVSISTGTITATTYYKFGVTCSASNASDSTLDSVVVIAHAAPVVVVSPTTANFCAGSTIPVIIAASGAEIYTWSPATGLNTNLGDTVLALPSINTRYTVTGTDSFGCTGTATANITVRNPPVTRVTAGIQPICIGDSISITDTVAGFGGTTFLWSPDGQTTAGITTAPTATTHYIVTTTGGSGCSRNDTVTVIVNSPPVAAFGYSANGTHVTFSDSSQNTTAWFWTFGTGDSSVSQNPAYTYPAPGNDTVTLIASASPCKSDTLTKVIAVYSLGVTTVSENANLSVFPNPASNNAHFTFTIAANTAEIWITNSLGQTVLKRIANAKANQQFNEDLNFAGFASGIYMVHVRANQKDFSVAVSKL